mmetsp:Transcript_12385/g.29263  ORF Transcript_12385/g.29263 Transcript_12385/m.29263 type:complete len:262 (-) Transcript_12385:388-1173(-)
MRRSLRCPERTRWAARIRTGQGSGRRRPSLPTVARRCAPTARRASAGRAAPRGRSSGSSSTTATSRRSPTPTQTLSCSSCRRTRRCSKTRGSSRLRRSSGIARRSSSRATRRRIRNCRSSDPSLSRRAGSRSEIHRELATIGAARGDAAFHGFVLETSGCAFEFCLQNTFCIGSKERGEFWIRFSIRCWFRDYLLLLSYTHVDVIQPGNQTTVFLFQNCTTGDLAWGGGRLARHVWTAFAILSSTPWRHVMRSLWFIGASR